jgi:hypothetical protein
MVQMVQASSQKMLEQVKNSAFKNKAVADSQHANFGTLGAQQ